MIREVEQFIWEGRPIVNQIVVSTEGQHYLISYGKVVATKGVNGAFLSKDWNRTRTTAKYVARFFDRSVKEMRKLIKEEVFKVITEITIE